MLINPFPLENFPTKPKIQNFFRTRVHTITLNTVTKYKLYPYIQISLNQIFGILSLCKNDKNLVEKWLSLNCSSTLFAHRNFAPIDPKLQNEISHRCSDTITLDMLMTKYTIHTTPARYVDSNLC